MSGFFWCIPHQDPNPEMSFTVSVPNDSPWPGNLHAIAVKVRFNAHGSPGGVGPYAKRTSGANTSSNLYGGGSSRNHIQVAVGPNPRTFSFKLSRGQSVTLHLGMRGLNVAGSVWATVLSNDVAYPARSPGLGLRVAGGSAYTITNSIAMTTVTRAPGSGLQSDDVQDGFSSEDGVNDYGELKTRVRAWAGEQDANSEHAQRWNRVLAALGDPDAIRAGYSPMPASEAQGYADNGWTRWDDVVTALTEIESRITAQAETEPEPEPEPEPVACVSGELEADVTAWSEETGKGADHVERWLRVLQTFKGTANDSTIVLSSEAQTYVDRGWNRWVEVRDAIRCLETRAGL